MPLVGTSGLSVAQAPDGTLVECRVSLNSLQYHKPIEPPSDAMSVKSIFPTRGPMAGGTVLDVYGVNFVPGNVTIEIGNQNCIIVEATSKVLQCTLPAVSMATGTPMDVIVTSGSESYTFRNGYRYVSGAPI